MAAKVQPVRAAIVIAILCASGCRGNLAPRAAKVPPGAARVIFVAPFELEPKDDRPAGLRFSSALEGIIRQRVEELGHVLGATEAKSELRLGIGAALEFHPAGDVKRVRLFVRVEKEGLLLDDWSSEPESFYLVPPREADLEAFADEVVSRLEIALGEGTRSR